MLGGSQRLRNHKYGGQYDLLVAWGGWFVFRPEGRPMPKRRSEFLSPPLVVRRAALPGAIYPCRKTFTLAEIRVPDRHRTQRILLQVNRLPRAAQ